jgi:hypothetical protein
VLLLSHEHLVLPLDHTPLLDEPVHRLELGDAVGVLGPTAHPGLPLKVFLGVGRCQRL